MTTLANPKIEVRIFTEIPLIINDLMMSFDVHKDVVEEPNDATVSIYNLGIEKRLALNLSELVEVPIEIHLTESGSSQLVLAFKGEIEDVVHQNLRPGHETRIYARSQKSSHYSAYVDQLTFAMGTPANVIFLALAAAVGLPFIAGVLPVLPITFSQSFTGLAFKQLEKFARDYGFRVFVNDGVLQMASIHQPAKLAPKVVLESSLLGDPVPRKIIDDEFVEHMTTNVIDNMLSTAKKKTKLSKQVGPTDYVFYQAVDKQLEGYDFEFFCQPDLQPDDLLTVVGDGVLDLAGKLFRVRDVNHYGDSETFDDWTTRVETVVFEGV